MSWWKRLLPLSGSLMLLALLAFRVPLADVLAALTQLNWMLLLPLSAAFVVVLYLWDGLCLQCLFADPARPLTYRAALAARGRSYVLAVLNWKAGQALLAWLVGQVQGKPFVATLTRCLILAYVDIWVLMTVGLLAALVYEHPYSGPIAAFCATALVGLLAATILVRLVPLAPLERIRQARWGRWLAAWDWDWSRLAPLGALRLVYFGFGMLYVVIALEVLQFDLETWRVLGAFPLAALADGLPISVSGLGTRETAYVLLLQPGAETARLLAFCLVWSAALIVIRAMIGLAFLWTGGLSTSAARPPATDDARRLPEAEATP